MCVRERESQGTCKILISCLEHRLVLFPDGVNNPKEEEEEEEGKKKTDSAMYAPIGNLIHAALFHNESHYRIAVDLRNQIKACEKQ